MRAESEAQQNARNEEAQQNTRGAPAADVHRRRPEELVRADSFGPFRQPAVHRGDEGGAGSGARRGGAVAGTFASGSSPPAELHDHFVRPAHHQQGGEFQEREEGAAKHPHKRGRRSTAGDSVARRSASPPLEEESGEGVPWRS
eukprot:CAMPEP_0113917764 /NCGR_PEP_ID=MMETSP0780_2-20120614/32926_1 /TAXON_ID=652834 /ORGANISM="Palpitomonas bilix" /LENGTH=143 /DNA_ID=CAMNT_0000917395 /DNA_START=1 /DNA_END=432 /DNA_ORIENTATION=- /assembly_acc=CAM_ASM_000599